MRTVAAAKGSATKRARMGFMFSAPIRLENESNSRARPSQAGRWLCCSPRVAGRDNQREQKSTRGEHLLPPFFVHVWVACCMADGWSAATAQPKILPSTTSAPHCLLNAVSTTHAFPRLEQTLRASLSALARSSLSCENPVIPSAALNAMAPQEMVRGGGGGTWRSAYEHDERSLEHLPHF